MPGEPAMSLSLRGGVAIVTGAAHGIGRALVLRLAEEGMSLALVDRDGETLETAAAAAKACGAVAVSTHRLDIADADAVAALPKAVIERHGRATLLVNNAGVALMGSFDEISLADLEWLMGINFWGTVRMTKAFMPLLKREQAAHIVNLSSVFGIIGPAGQTAYSASKFAVRGFSESLRHELADSNISISVVHPGGIATDIAAHARVPDTIDAKVAKAAIDGFRRVARTSPTAAADRILRGIKKREKRILIGGDARLIDIVQRLMPVTYWRVFGRAFSTAGAR
jgi:short-subunit dehydrogenase